MQKLLLIKNNKIFSLALALLLGVLGFLLFYRLGGHPFLDWDESIYAQVVKEMLSSHRWLSFSYFGQPWYEKPPLMLWIVAIFVKLFGNSEFIYRLPVSIFAYLTVLLSAYFTWLLSRSRQAVLLCLAFFCISLPFLSASYFLQFDSLVALLILLQMILFYKTFENKNYWLWLGLVLALSVLTKNIVGLFLLPAFGLILLFKKQLVLTFKEKYFWVAVLTFFIIASPWHIYSTYIAGTSFWQNYFIYHVLDRATTNLEHNGQPFTTFIRMIFIYYPISSFIFGLGFVTSIIQGVKNRDWYFAIMPFIVLLLLFSASNTKLPAYITPAIPFLVISVACSWTKLIEYVPKYMHTAIIVVLIFICVYLGLNYNAFKISKAENSIRDLDTKKVGLFLKNYHTDFDIYDTRLEYKNLAIGYYSDRKVSNLTLSIDQKNEIKKIGARVFHISSLEVWASEKSLYIISQ